MYLSTLLCYVEAIHVKLKLTLKLPIRTLLRLQSLGNVTADQSRRVRGVAGIPTAL
ncbi:hypothetical protein A4U53_033245 [Rhizobium ruizarguesonis]|uniref:Uncharacterized protein n=1 Tax=Rhizobium ruizarguesonis TaxID=2081791 RepID=A0ACD5ENP2_9HYPH|nr:hypothetical protein [Rhizobium leguminosarum]